MPKWSTRLIAGSSSSSAWRARSIFLTRGPRGARLARAYVKVYARNDGGGVGFYKDGYTDLRGAFDYASLSTDELDRVERFAILVMSDEHGALIREAAPPQR